VLHHLGRVALGRLGVALMRAPRRSVSTAWCGASSGGSRKRRQAKRVLFDGLKLVGTGSIAIASTSSRGWTGVVRLHVR
jgi:hypothetical protein